MKNICIFFLALMLCTSETSCSVINGRHQINSLRRTVVQLEENQQQLEAKQKTLTQGIFDSLEAVPASSQTQEVKLAERLTVTLLKTYDGVDNTGMKIPVEKILNNDVKTQKDGQKELSKFEDSVNKTIEDKHKLEEKKQKIEDKIIDEAAKKQIIEEHSLWGKIKLYTVMIGAFLILGALIYVFPPTISILGRIGSGLLGIIRRILS